MSPLQHYPHGYVSQGILKTIQTDSEDITSAKLEITHIHQRDHEHLLQIPSGPTSSNLILGAMELALWVEVLTAKPANLGLILASLQWEERADSLKLSSNLHMYTNTHTHTIA